MQFASSGAVSIFVFASNLRGPERDVSSPKTERRLLSPDRSPSILDVTRISRILSVQWKFGFRRRSKRYRYVRVNEKNDERFLIPRVLSDGSAERSGSSEVALAARRRKKRGETTFRAIVIDKKAGGTSKRRELEAITVDGWTRGWSTDGGAA